MPRPPHAIDPAATFAFIAFVTLVAILAGAPAAAPAVEITPRVGVDFDHFGETYRLSEDADTVATINDAATFAGIVLRSTDDLDRRYRFSGEFHFGQQTRRVALDFDGRWQAGATRWEFENDGSYRFYADDGDYSVSGDHFQDYARVTWDRRLTERFRFRLRDSFDATWYESPDEYNLSSMLHRPTADLRIGLGDLSEARVGYELGVRDVPDSTSLGYVRHAAEADLSLLFGWTSAFDFSERVERRLYDEDSVRESSWEVRTDASFEFAAGSRATFRILHEDEIVRYDVPDELDFDSVWARTGFQVEVHRSRYLDLSIMPLHAFLVSDTVPEEEYTEAGLEFGLDWRIGKHTWINLTDEIGRRDYEIDATAETDTDFAFDVLLTDSVDVLDTAWSDYLYNRLTLLLTSEVRPGISVSLFANWQPEDHRVNTHDTDTRIVSGGVEYEF